MKKTPVTTIAVDPTTDRAALRDLLVDEIGYNPDEYDGHGSWGWDLDIYCLADALEFWSETNPALFGFAFTLNRTNEGVFSGIDIGVSVGNDGVIPRFILSTFLNDEDLNRGSAGEAGAFDVIDAMVRAYRDVRAAAEARGFVIV